MYNRKGMRGVLLAAMLLTVAAGLGAYRGRLPQCSRRIQPMRQRSEHTAKKLPPISFIPAAYLMTFTRGVSIVRTNVRVPAKSFQPLRVGDEIQVDASRASIILRSDGQRWLLTTGTRVRVETSGIVTLKGSLPVRQARVGDAALKAAGTVPLEGQYLGRLLNLGIESRRLFRWLRIERPQGSIKKEPTELVWVGGKGIVESNEIEDDGVLLTDTHLLVRIKEEQTGKIVDEGNVPVFATHYSVPPGRLHPGTEYVWSVTAVLAKSARGKLKTYRGEGRFRILTESEVTWLSSVEQEAKDLERADPADPCPDLLLAVAYESLHLNDDYWDARDRATYKAGK